jgi:hypothetical protein
MKIYKGVFEFVHFVPFFLLLRIPNIDITTSRKFCTKKKILNPKKKWGKISVTPVWYSIIIKADVRLITRVAICFWGFRWEASHITNVGKFFIIVHEKITLVHKDIDLIHNSLCHYNQRGNIFLNTPLQIRYRESIFWSSQE